MSHTRFLQNIDWIGLPLLTICWKAALPFLRIDDGLVLESQQGILVTHLKFVLFCCW